MAEMIPDRLPPRSSRGEQEVFFILQGLPDDCIVYYEPIISARYPDFVVIGPTLGVLIIEVKGWQPKHLHGVDSHQIVVLEGGQPVQRPHPLRQARDYMYGLMDYCRQQPAFKTLVHPDGDYQNRFIFPFGFMAVLSNITQDQLKNHALGDLTTLFPYPKVIPRDVLLEQWRQLRPADLPQALGKAFDPWWTFSPLNEPQINALRAIIHPEVQLTLHLTPAAKPAVPVTPAPTVLESLKVLDLCQERNARALGDGHRIVYGVAGSGKTVLLIARARVLIAQGADLRVLLRCFNVSLAAYLRGCLSDCRNATVCHFDGWSKWNGITRQRDEDNDSLGERLRAHLEAGRGEAETYDAILIDEAQDFAPSWFQCAKAAMKEPDDGDLIIVGDGSQGLYRGQRDISWKKLGIKAQGRTVHRDFALDKNYRNSREILELAAAFATTTDTVATEADHLQAVTVNPINAVRRTGQRPVLILAQNRRQETLAVVGIVEQLLNGASGFRGFDQPLPPEDIGLLYPRYDHSILDLKKRLERHGPVVWMTDKNDRNARQKVNAPGLKLHTIHVAKGLQYRVVILLWADQLPGTFADSDEAADCCLMYVALTRPEDLLFITVSQPSPFVQRIQDSGKVEVRQLCQSLDVICLTR
ncbi:MAG: NERD domain-containing protein, partial [Candidatus Competibacteraceae bacterium]|nr:NERD domain-containing protein [Candidatus Competibacteraceae bacterium]